MSEVITIRPSGMPQYSDCGRRSAARGWADIVRAAGYELRTTLPSIGAVIGTTTHLVLQAGLRARALEQAPDIREMDALAAGTITKEISSGVVWDDTTANKDAARLQAMKQARVVLDTMPDFAPHHMEEFAAAKLVEGYQLAGTLDFRTHMPEEEIAPGTFLSAGEAIDDLKTGTLHRANQAQYGGYSLINRAQGRATRRLREIYVPRVGVSKPQPAPTIIEYPVQQAEEIAYHTAHRTAAELTAFRKTGNPWVWLPNPNSMMCGVKFCPAWGTKFCTSHKQGANQ